MDTQLQNIPETYSGPARERILKDLRTLASDAEALLRATAHDVTDKAKEARARLASTIERARSSYEDLQAQGLRSAKTAASRADNAVRHHPYESAGIAFSAGLLVGLLVGRR